MKNRLLHACAAVLLFTSAAQAQSYLPSETAVRMAVEQSPTVQAADAARRGAQARADGLRVGPHETVIRASGQRRWTHDGSGQRFTEGQIAIERPLRLWGKAAVDGELAEATRATGRLAAQDARHETARQLLALWFAALRAGQARQAAQGNADAAAELANITERRLRVGDAARLEAELAAAEQARMQAALAGAEAAQTSARADLCARFPDLCPMASTSSDAATLPTPPSGSETQLRLRYIEHSHEYLLAQSEEALALHQARRTDLERRPDPTVGVFATSERGGSERIAGISISLPLGSVHRQSQAAAALADADTALSRRLAVERRLGAEFDVLWSQLKGKRAAATAQAQTVTLQRSATDRAMRAYRAGESGLADLLAARRVLAEAVLAERMSHIDTLESDSRLRLDLHEMWDFDD
ncbi:TolC family protein [Comamonas thiooxydans]|uniref:TolC family protein n=1 Tax=Comamonas thiooxydans TaxID=363952 RepID=UPI00209C1037|nr:TolC family protein [Comamonas thiooxydans]MCO8252040.1 TolC family protein [Comamonas thiooxydans]